MSLLKHLERSQKQQLIIFSILFLTLIISLAVNIKGNHLINQNRSQLNDEHYMASWLEKKVPTLLQAQHTLIQKKAFSGNTLESIVKEAIYQLHLNSEQPTFTQLSDTKLQVEFKSIPFTKCYYLIASLWQGNLIRVHKMTLNACQNPGIVRGVIVLESQ